MSIRNVVHLIVRTSAANIITFMRIILIDQSKFI